MGRKTGFENSSQYMSYITSSAWREKADRRLEIDHHVCCVCGKRASSVHHLTYEHFGHEQMADLVSLCHQCHEEAENLYDPSIFSWAIESEGNFMAAMRADAQKIAPVVFDYLMEVNGSDFDSLMRLRQPQNKGDKHWSVLRNAVRALCGKRYYQTCVEDRSDMMISAITNHSAVICLSKIEHFLRNNVQASLRDAIYGIYEDVGTWKKVSEETGLSQGTVTKLKNDNGIGDSKGPSLREEVLYYCGLDAAAGIRPLEDFQCLTDEDYQILNQLANYEAEVSGNGTFKGEFMRSTI